MYLFFKICIIAIYLWRRDRQLKTDLPTAGSFSNSLHVVQLGARNSIYVGGRNPTTPAITASRKLQSRRESYFEHRHSDTEYRHAN